MVSIVWPWFGFDTKMVEVFSDVHSSVVPAYLGGFLSERLLQHMLTSHHHAPAAAIKLHCGKSYDCLINTTLVEKISLCNVLMRWLIYSCINEIVPR